MNRALKIVFGMSCALGLLWTLSAAMAQGAGGLAVVFLFLVIYPLFGVFFLFAAWMFWKRPEQRKLAGWTMAIPVIAWFLPYIIRGMSGGAISTGQLMSLVLSSIVVATLAAWVFPRQAARFVPDRLARSRLFNWLILLAMIGAWAFLVAVVIYVSTGEGSSGGSAVAYAIILAALYLVGIGVGSFGAATWAWVSLRGGFEATARKLNVAQMIVAAPGIAIAVLVASWLVEQGRL